MTFRSPQQMVDMTEPALLVQANSKTTAAVTAMELHMTNNAEDENIFDSGL